MWGDAWKSRERKVAKSFGALRNIGSGSMGRPDKSCSDSTHETLFLEVKLRAKHTAVQLYDKTAKLAKKEKKIPVVVLAEKGRPGTWLVLRQKDLPHVAAEYAKARLEELKGDLPGQTKFIGDDDENEETA